MHVKTQPEPRAPVAAAALRPVSESRWQAIWQSPGWMVGIAFAVRVLWVTVAHTYRLRVSEEHFGFGWEIGRIAYSLANGHGFSSPFGGDTGPSAWTAPLYPWLLAAAFRLFGSYSHAAAFAMLVFNSLCGALTTWTIYRTARRVFGVKVALWSGWIWALLPYTIFWSVRYIWETSLSAFLLSLIFMLTLGMEGDARLSSWLGYGVLWGVAALSNPAALAFLPIAGGWLVYQLYRRGKAFLLPAALSALVFWLTLMPWLVRNYQVMGRPVFIRDNFGNELRVGNNPLAEGIYVLALHPADNQLLLAKYAALGEPAFCAEQGRLAKQWIAQHPGKFVDITARRVVFFWSGMPRDTRIPWLGNAKNLLFLASSIFALGGLLLALKRRVPDILLFAGLVLAYPLVYYLCFPEPRYRHPIEPQLLILGVYLVTEARPRNATSLNAEDLPDFEQAESLPQFHTLSVIIPVYNERRTVMKLLQQVARQPLGLNKEIIIIDDASTDGTRELLQQPELPRLLGSNGANTVRLVLQQKNMGKGAAVRAGLEHVTGELVLFQDADLEYDPRDYPALIAPIMEGHADAVFGNRFHSGAHRVPRYGRYLLNRVFSILCNTLTGLQVHDVTACYKVFRREIFDQMQIRSDRFSIETEITVKLAKLGARIYEVPIAYHGRTYAEGKKISWADGLLAVYHLLVYRFKD